MRPLQHTPEVCRCGQIEASVSCRAAGPASGPAMRDRPADFSPAVGATGSDRRAPRPTVMAASEDVRVGVEAGRPSGGVEPAWPHHRQMDTPGRCARRGRRDGVLASLGAAPKRSAGGHGRGIGFPLINQHAAAVRGRLAGRVRRHHVAVACARSDCWEKADGVPVGAHGGDRRGVAPRV